LNKTQLSWSALTAIDDWVRARKVLLPKRYAAQLGQLQFHCGKPPPAAEPKTRILTVKPYSERQGLRSQPTGTGSAGWLGSRYLSCLAVGDVHRDFKAKAHIACCGCFPCHCVSPVVLCRTLRLEVPAACLPVPR
jgi:hypothetical protein